MIPASNKPFEILSCKVPGIRSEDLLIDDVDQYEEGSILSHRIELPSNEEVNEVSAMVDEVSGVASDDLPPQRRGSMASDLDLIRPKEKMLSVSFIMDSMPGYILVVSKVIQPVFQHETKDD